MSTKTPFIQYSQNRFASFLNEINAVATTDTNEKQYQAIVNKIWSVLDRNDAKSLETAIATNFTQDHAFEDRSIKYAFTIVDGKTTLELLIPILGKTILQSRALAIAMAQKGTENTPELLRNALKEPKYGVSLISQGNRYEVFGFEGLIPQEQIFRNLQYEYRLFSESSSNTPSKLVTLNNRSYKITDFDKLKVPA